jgi:hypothetical protein
MGQDQGSSSQESEGRARTTTRTRSPCSSSCSKAQGDATDGTYRTHGTYATGRCRRIARDTVKNALPDEEELIPAFLPTTASEFDSVRCQSRYSTALGISSDIANVAPRTGGGLKAERLIWRSIKTASGSLRRGSNEPTSPACRGPPFRPQRPNHVPRGTFSH